MEADTIRDALADGLGIVRAMKACPDDVRDALAGGTRLRAQWPLSEGLTDNAQEEELTDERHWPAGVHAGIRRVAEGHVLAPDHVEGAAA